MLREHEEKYLQEENDCDKFMTDLLDSEEDLVPDDDDEEHLIPPSPAKSAEVVKVDPRTQDTSKGLAAMLALTAKRGGSTTNGSCL